jgi:hypothetical protein
MNAHHCSAVKWLLRRPGEIQGLMGRDYTLADPKAKAAIRGLEACADRHSQL